jgi:periplasmic divalent cation tolerance protein
VSPRRADPVRVVLLAAPPRRARALARALVERRLAACVNLLPGAGSVYRWKGRVEEVRETLLLAKTTASRAAALLAAVAELHPYEVPEGILLPAEGGLAPYLAWVAEETRPEAPPPAPARATRRG